MYPSNLDATAPVRTRVAIGYARTSISAVMIMAGRA